MTNVASLSREVEDITFPRGQSRVRVAVVAGT
jgi:hypothetical protein